LRILGRETTSSVVVVLAINCSLGSANQLVHIPTYTKILQKAMLQEF